jgi:hypothetical protein
MRTVTVTRRKDKRSATMLVLGLFVVGILAGVLVRHDVVGTQRLRLRRGVGGQGKAEASALIKDRSRKWSHDRLPSRPEAALCRSGELAVDLDEAH